MQLMNAVDSFIPIPARLVDKDFLMPVEDVFSITGRGTVATGRIERGVINSGEPVDIIGMGAEGLKSTVTGVEMFRKILDRGEAGDNVGLLLRGIEKSQIKRGMIICKPGSVKPHSHFKAEVYELSKEEGGRHTPFFNKYRPQFYMRTTDVTGEITLPEGVNLTRVSDKSLSEMLASGEIDCAIIARPPTCFLEGNPDIVRLFPDYLEMEEEYYARTKVWPIMHIIAMKKSVVEEHPWVPRNLYNGFLESKRRSIERLMDPAVSRYPLPWLATYARKMRDMFDGDTFPFGIEENRATWEQMALYTFQQGIAHKQFTPEEIFPNGMMTKVVI
jgi:hypothetical protein